jgi:hypothetical protein
VENKDNGRSCSVQKLAVQVSIMAFGGGPIEESNGNNHGNRARAAVASSLGTTYSQVSALLGLW